MIPFYGQENWEYKCQIFRRSHTYKIRELQMTASHMAANVIGPDELFRNFH